ncbi:MAG TPA: hypothetical protein VHK91_00335 [Flavisolibacter sp.]|jgi:hypothetical protein|nr:hypothetical protein [Flavisolibacter sp.]
MEKEEKFWNWFEESNNKYLNLDLVTDEDLEDLMGDFFNNLQEYSKYLFFQIGNKPTSDISELIISAEGNKNHFIEVDNLVSSAPKFSNWNIIAFKPSLGCNFITTYEDIKLDPKEIFFMPLNSNLDKNKIGIRICIKGYKEEVQLKYKNAVFQLLDALLGEKKAAEINYFDLENLMNYENYENDLISLCDLAEYIEWKLSKMQ